MPRPLIEQAHARAFGVAVAEPASAMFTGPGRELSWQDHGPRSFLP